MKTSIHESFTDKSKIQGWPASPALAYALICLVKTHTALSLAIYRCFQAGHVQVAVLNAAFEDVLFILPVD